MSNEELAKLLKYSSPYSILIIDKRGRLKELRCPFKVVVITSIGVLRSSQIVDVIQVKVTSQLSTVYIISGLAYHYYYFDIM